MNKAITDGIVFMPLPFSAGLGVWSSGDGTPGSDTYAGSGTGVLVQADADFAGCLEVQKTATVQKLRYMGETPILPGCYLRISAKVKAVAGPMPNVRVAGWAGRAGGGAANVPTTTGPAKALPAYGEVVEVTAIVGTGERTGVDMVWQGAAYGHFGIDLTGPSGGLVRVDDIVIEDITVAFQRDMMAMVDVRDFGAVGDGVANDAPAFEAADAAAAGREILVPAGIFRLADSVTIQNRIRFEGTVTQPRAKHFILQNDFNYEVYLDAFGNEEEAFKKAYQALLNFADHESLDLCGRRISLSAPVDLQACDPDANVYETRRVIRNGQFTPIDGPVWSVETVTSQASYSSGNATRLTNVVNVANVPVGALVQGSGVGREVYVTARNVGAQTLDLSAPLYDANGTQTFTFRRNKYLLDCSGYQKHSQLIFDDIDFNCAGIASGVLLAPEGRLIHFRDCYINKPFRRGITSPGVGCQGLMIDRCNFVSNEQGERVQDRVTIAFNANANDVKIRDNRAALFKHFCVLQGTGSLISGNHYFLGDTETNGVRRGGIIFTTPNCKSVMTGNYIDNNFIEWTNEHEADPAFANQFSFGGLTVTGNTFTVNDVTDGFNFIVVKPYGPDHFIDGFSVVSNVFRSLNGQINRVEAVDTSFADLNYFRMKAITFAGNTFHNVRDPVQNPAVLSHAQNSTSKTWIAETEPSLPFRGQARFIDAVCADGPITDAGGNDVFQMPWADNNYGPDKRQVRFVWDTPVKGDLRFTVRMDNPL